MYDDWDGYDDLIARANDMVDGAVVPVLGIRILHYMDNQGRTRFTFGVRGDSPLTSVLGALELAKARVLDSYGDEEDDDG